MYHRIVAFGCSNTYGHGLSDCTVEGTDKAGPVASKFAWPALVDSNKPYLNLSKPGSSNKQIAMDCLAQEFIETDIVIFVWTYAVRTFYVNKSKELHQFVAADPKINRFRHDAETIIAHHSWLKFNASRSLLDIIINQFMYVKLADYHVKSFGAKVLHCTIDHYFKEFDKTQLPENLYLPMHNISDILMFTDPLPDGHAGPRGQQLAAKFIKRRLAKL